MTEQVFWVQTLDADGKEVELVERPNRIKAVAGARVALRRAIRCGESRDGWIVVIAPEGEAPVITMAVRDGIIETTYLDW